jgi:hypothetical protein
MLGRVRALTTFGGRSLLAVGVLLVATAGAAFAFAAGAPAATTPAADASWLPHPAGAQWQYRWTDSEYNTSGTVENVDVQQQSGSTFTLGWAAQGQQIPAAGTTSLTCPQATPVPDLGTVSFEDTDSGLINTDWNSCPPPPNFPVLCPTTSCANSLASTLYNLIWGDRVPLISEPLLQGTSWTATGGAQNDVSSSSQYLGEQLVKVPAFPNGVHAAEIRSTIAQAGALGDPYGSGVRTTWWAYGVGPVQISFAHSGGMSAPVTTAVLESTNLTPVAPPPDQDYFPLRQGLSGTYKWTNSKHLAQPEVETVSVSAVLNRTAQVTVKSVSGPIKAAGSYLYTLRAQGLINTQGTASAATLAKLPKLGHGRHFFTPIDLMNFGFNPILPAYPRIGSSWRGGSGSDFDTYGVTGSSKLVGMQRVTVPAGTFNALEVETTLTQRGYPFGSGVRTCWFAPGRGLVKLLFRHGDGSVSLVQLLK